MSGFNDFCTIGNLTRDPQLRYTASGKPVASFTVAVNGFYTAPDGSKKESVDFIPVTTFGRQAENDSKYLKKGRKVAVKMRVRSWYDEAKKRGGFNFEAYEVMYLGASRGGDSESTGGSADPAPTPDHDAWLADYEGASMPGAHAAGVPRA